MSEDFKLLDDRSGRDEVTDKDATDKLLLLREPNSTYTAIIDTKNGSITVECKTWRKMRAELRSLGYSIGRVLESEIQDGLGVLEKAMR